MMILSVDVCKSHGNLAMLPIDFEKSIKYNNSIERQRVLKRAKIYGEDLVWKLRSTRLLTALTH